MCLKFSVCAHQWPLLISVLEKATDSLGHEDSDGHEVVPVANVICEMSFIGLR